jgi:Fe-Mn family superoxide dismutase
MEVMMRNLNRKPEHWYGAKVLPFRMPLKGISNRTLENHHDKLYMGYVKKKNEIENRLEELKDPEGNTTYSELRALKDGETYAANGVYLHEWYFDGLGGNGEASGATELVGEIEKSFGSLDFFKKFFTQCAMAARGWTVLAWDTKESRLWIYNCDAHNQGGVWGALPVIVLDMYEHAYFIDFGADKEKYIEAFWKNFNWSTANDLFKRVSAVRLAA